MREKVDAIAAHGINCFVNRQLIYNFPESLLAERGIMVIEHADFDGVERLSLVTAGEIASTFERPEMVKLGSCELIEEVMVGEDKVSPYRSFSLLLLTNALIPLAHQIFRCCSWRSMHGRPARFHLSNGRRSRTFPTRRPLRPLPNSKRDTNCPRRRLLRDAHVLRR